jgi:hypothetical protein
MSCEHSKGVQALREMLIGDDEKFCLKENEHFYPRHLTLKLLLLPGNTHKVILSAGSPWPSIVIIVECHL